MNTLTIELLEEDYKSIPQDVRDRLIIKSNEPKDFIYEGWQEWREAKKEADKAFRELKRIEFKIRNKQ